MTRHAPFGQRPIGLLAFRHLCVGLAVVALGAGAGRGWAGPVDFEFSLPSEARVSAGVYRPDGGMVRTLWSLQSFPAGRNHGTWDGRDDEGRNLPAGKYEVRLALGGAVYRSLGVIGNNGIGISMQSHTSDLRVDTSSGHIFTANNWEEAGQDYKRIDAEGRHVMDAKFRARNGVGGAPNGMPISIAVDDQYLYTGIYTNRDEYEHRPGNVPGGQIIRKFHKDTGDPVKFTEGPTAFLRVHYPDPAWESPWGHESLHSLVVRGDVLLAADEKFDRVLKFDKTTGRRLGQFAVKAPRSLALDAAGRLWIAYDGDKVGIFDVDGRRLVAVEHSADPVECLRLDTRGRLWLASSVSGRLMVLRVDPSGRTTVEKSYGQKPRPGRLDPLDLYKQITFDVMGDGGFVLAQSPGKGCVMSRFDPAGKLLWQQVGLEFCTNGTYDRRQPDLFISSTLNAYRLMDLTSGQWRFEGNLCNSEQLTGSQSTGNPRILTLGGRQFYYILHGDRVLVLRFDSGRLTPATLLGLGPRAWKDATLGKLAADETQQLWFTWRDENGDGQVQAGEVVKQKPTARLGGFSIDVDRQGNLIFSNHATRSVYEMPLVRLDGRGTPVYEFATAREVLPPDASFRGLRPMKAVRTPEGFYYVLQPADPSYYPTTKFSGGWNYCWMGGWTVSKYDRQGRRLFIVVLPEHCTGLDWVPDPQDAHEQGFVAGGFTGKQLFHYSSDGLLLGILSPTHETGWLDHNGSMSICRNPVDKMVDIFAEESYRNRISWYRADDRAVRTIVVAIAKASAGDEPVSTEAQFQALIESARAKQKGRDLAGAEAMLQEALRAAAARERPMVRLMLGRLLLGMAGRKPDGLALLEQVAADASCEPLARAELWIEIARHRSALKQTEQALAALAKIREVPTPRDRRFDYRTVVEAGRVHLAAGNPEEAIRQAELAMKLRSQPDPDGQFLQAYYLKGDALVEAKRPSEAIALYEDLLKQKIANESHLTDVESHIARIHVRAGDHARAAEVLSTALRKYAKMPIYQKPGILLEAADCYQRAGNKQQARACCGQVLEMPDAPGWAKDGARDRLKRLETP